MLWQIYQVILATNSCQSDRSSFLSLFLFLPFFLREVFMANIDTSMSIGPRSGKGLRFFSVLNGLTRKISKKHLRPLHGRSLWQLISCQYDLFEIVAKVSFANMTRIGSLYYSLWLNNLLYYSIRFILSITSICFVSFRVCIYMFMFCFVHGFCHVAYCLCRTLSFWAIYLLNSFVICTEYVTE